MSTTATKLRYDEHARLVERLADAEPSTLLMVLVQLTGDMALLDRYGPMLAKPGEFNHRIPEADLRELLSRLAGVLMDETHVAPEIGPTELHGMMNAFCREEVSERYLPMLFEDLGFKSSPKHMENASPKAKAQVKEFNVLVIGAGASGINAGIQLTEAGIPYQIVERHDDVGGVWHENTYPDCGVDSANHLYCYSFALNHNWSRYYVRQAELKAYLKDCATRYGVMEHIRFRQEVLSVRFDTTDNLWHCIIRMPDGSERAATANAIICSVGQLNQPMIPKIKGLEDYKGEQMHTARWNHSYDFAGKNAAMIGTGASGMQAGPALARIARHLTIFQRGAPWVLPRHNYHNLVADNVKWVLANVPHYARWYRFLLFWAYGDGIHDALIRDPTWKGGKLAISERSEAIRKLWTQYIDEVMADRPDLRAKVLPDYAPFGKRSLRDNGWFETLKRDNVELNTDGIDHIAADAIVDKTGKRHPVDAIVWATGFHASRMVYPMDVIGANGKSLRELWGDDDPRAYLGICVPGFPNFFMTYGPNTNLAHGGSIIFQAECQVHYILKCLETLFETGKAAMDCTQAAHDAYNEKLDKALSRMVWTNEGVTNWYQNKRGRVTTNSPWRLVEYWELTRKPDPAAFNFIGESN
ncbi:NAD(P)/FAD-dependent oxidoreductase [Chelativorans sp. AA-79]|uniref:flavin-containing monooxygenase n=1 Tax=Chelativorans sp. AA-79 TaxID=3028735 RepID=UPI0023F8CE8B|nr:NAD(P)/FAD-dependent oxidoreductase [Chelativorans sp. AA-79]WEX08086.1 NAD(P)/FAD-dependent oxidoreductase [Chelativorans sp. AA-79]